MDVEPFKGLLLGVFFLYVGMTLNLSTAFNDPLRIVMSVVGLYVLKSAIVYVLARLSGLAREVAAETSLLLGQGGEFAFVVLTLALSLGVVEAPIVEFIMVVTILSMLVTPTMARVARTVGASLAPAKHDVPDSSLSIPEALPGLPAGHVVIAGYGRVGQLLGDLLEAQCIPYVAIDVDIAAVSKFRGEDRPAYFGNGSDPNILERLSVKDASALVVTMDDDAAAEQIVSAAFARWPGLPIVVRARDKVHALRLLSKGATSVVPETIEASLDLAEVVFNKAGIGAEVARQIVADRRLVERATLTAQSE